jgi:hypothetical protein
MQLSAGQKVEVRKQAGTLVSRCLCRILHYDYSQRMPVVPVITLFMLTSALDLIGLLSDVSDLLSDLLSDTV